MAGRLQIALTPEELAFLYRIQKEAWPDRVKLPRYNLTPRQSLPVIVAERRLVAMRWGFPPVWKPNPFNQPPLFNAKAEEVREKATWKKPVAERRAIVPATGFYEWRPGPGGPKDRQPVWFRRKDGRPLSLAAVWGTFDWEERKGWPCVSVLTTAPEAVVAPIHDRMPLLLEPEDEDRWLAPGDDWMSLLSRPVGDCLEFVPVSPRLNQIDQDDAGLLDPAG